MRAATVSRDTGEVSITVELNVDGSGRSKVSTGITMLDHMLAQLARHGVNDLNVEAVSKMDPDGHHMVEDVAITLGQAFNQALGDKRGIVRMATASAPLDESLATVTVDISGRGYAVVNVTFGVEKVGDLLTDLVRHFLETFAREARLNLHADIVRGVNDHHKVECLFKALARALDAATRIDARVADIIPSTKGIIET